MFKQISNITIKKTTESIKRQFSHMQSVENEYLTFLKVDFYSGYVGKTY